MQKESGKRESPYKGILRFANEKETAIIICRCPICFVLCFWCCSIYRGCNLAAKGIGKQSDNDLGNPLAGHCSVRVSSKAYPLREIYALFPQSSL